MTIITDPLFYMVAVPALIALGLSKGGFAGVGVLATPLTALYLPPLEAAALILPVLIVQDMISVWWYRREYDPWNLKVMLPGALLGMALAWMFAAYVNDDALRISVGVIGISFVIYSLLKHIPAEGHRKTALSGAFWGGVSGFTSFLSQAGGPPFQVHVLPQRLPKLTLVGTNVIFFAIVNALEDRAVFRARPVLHDQFRHLDGAAADRGRGQCAGHLSGAGDAGGGVLPDRLCAGILRLGDAAVAGCHGPDEGLGSSHGADTAAF
jgi:uncharacterized protein